jgi:hypothetical protein
MLDRCEQKVSGPLTDSDYQLLALRAASCAEHILTCSSRPGPEEPRSRHAIEQARAWVRGEITMSQARTAAGHVIAAARADGRSEPPRKATVGNLIAADVETVPDLAERQRLRVLANDRPGSLSSLVFQSP